jgi:hypothetical protein
LFVEISDGNGDDPDGFDAGQDAVEIFGIGFGVGEDQAEHNEGTEAQGNPLHDTPLYGQIHEASKKEKFDYLK